MTNFYPNGDMNVTREFTQWPLREGQISIFAVISTVTQTFTDISGSLCLIFIIYTSMDRY